MVPSPFATELIAEVGFDFVMIDCQHGLIGYDSMVPMLQAMARTSAVPLVRVPPDSAAQVGAALDAGASGVVVPMVSTPEEAKRAAAACRYPIAGNRSLGPVRSGMLIKGSPSEVNRQVLCIVMIETLAGVEAANEICGTPGIDGVMVGWADLALSMGFSPGSDSSELKEAMSAVLLACEQHRIVAAIASDSPDKVEKYVDEGYRMILVASDYRLLSVGAKDRLECARALGVSDS
jgi:4-hydroxy-2-oxoheptanedioate aldolase